MRLLLLDNFDSFTFTLADYLRQLGAEVLVRRNDVPLAELQALDFDGIVLSPGPGTPAQAGVMPAVITTVWVVKPTKLKIRVLPSGAFRVYTPLELVEVPMEVPRTRECLQSGSFFGYE